MTTSNFHEEDFSRRPRFKSRDELRAYRRACDQECQRAMVAKSNCPLRKDDRQFTKAIQVGRECVVCDIIVRAEGSIEFWVKPQNDEPDPNEPRGTHHSFSLVLELGLKKGEEEGEPDFFYDTCWSPY